ncbi:hypothetical protein PR202_gb07194 [Eleusine coracana subsp. coracana]|uniref:Uncharacterized protein n=1 Tax=Eleusine coracana subsp. coracana TaxID=191504 RepID=A0AAV5EBI7_ELECO|nr:hypothetical protein PR202_gb07194 [Eleusine coracana subsp. coracana]
MDTQQLLLLAALLVLPLTALLLARRHGRGKKTGARLPPGPPSVPVLGNLLWLTHSSSDIEPLLRRLVEKYGPVVSLRMGSRLLIFVADRRLAHAALVGSGAALADRPSLTRGLLGENDNTISRSSYGPTWRLLRRNMVAETLHPSRVRLFSPARAWVRRVLVDKLREQAGDAEPRAGGDGGRLDEPAVRAIAAAQRDWLAFVAKNPSVFAFLPALTRRVFRRRLQAGLDARRRQKELFVPLINARRDRKKQPNEAAAAAAATKKDTTFEHAYVDTLLDLRLPNEEDGHDRALTDDEMANLCSEFLTAGTDTTSTALQWIMAELVKNPSIQAKLHAEIESTCNTNQDEEVSEEDTHAMPYLKAVVLEGLRRHPPAHFVLTHKAAEDVEVGGYTIPKGAAVNFTVAEMGWDAREWDRPMEFVPERFLPGGEGDGVDVTGSREIRMMPFGAGRRICAGLGVAMLHLEYFVANLVREFEWKEVPGHEVDLTETQEFTTVMKKPLRASLVPRRNQSTPTPHY